MNSPKDLDATQPISQSYYEEIIKKSRSTKISAPPNVGQGGTHSQLTLHEGDDGHIDIASSFLQHNEDSQVAEHENIDFPPTQSQLRWTQFPESQRFKTPVTVGKKRRHDGQVVETPASTRNPLLKNDDVTPAGIIGLSQAFAATQAASSPFDNGLPTNLRSDRPSPNIQRHGSPIKVNSSSPLRTISEYRRAATEPATRYVSARQSQTRRSTRQHHLWSSDGISENHPSHENDSDDEQANSTSQRRTEQQGEEPRQSRLTKQGTRKNIGEMLDDRDFDKEQALESGESEAETDHGDDIAVAVRRSSQAQHAGVFDKENAPNLIPETTFRKQHGIVSQVDGSPSERVGRVEEDGFRHSLPSSGPVRVADSQPSQRRLHEHEASHAEEYPDEHRADRVSASQGGTDGPANDDSHKFSHRIPVKYADQRNSVGVDRSEKNDLLEDQLNEQGQNSTSIADLPSTVQETNPSHQENENILEPRSKHGVTGLDAYDSNVNKAASGHIQKVNTSTALLPPFTSPTLSKAANGERRLMRDISDVTSPHKSATQSSFNAAEVLALDADIDSADLLANSRQPSYLPSHAVTSIHPAEHQQTSEAPENLATLNAESVNYSNVYRQKSDQNNTDRFELSPEQSQEILRHSRRHKGLSSRQESTRATKSRRRVSEFDLESSPEQSLHAQDVLLRRKRMRGKNEQQPSAGSNAQNVKSTPEDNVDCDAMSRPLQRVDEAPLLQYSKADETTPDDDANIVAPNMVFACFNGQIRAYYPALCLGAAQGDATRFEVQFEGCAPDTVDKHGICALNLRIGDNIKINMEGFPKVPHVVKGLKGSLNQSPTSSGLTDIYGHQYIIVAPKQRKGSLRASASENQKEIPFSAVYLDNNMWGQMKDREYHYVEVKADSHRPYSSTPPLEPGTPSTPPSRARRLPAPTIKQPVLAKTGLFANMAFAISLDDVENRNVVSKAVQSNGGFIIHDTFSELFVSGVILKPNLTKLHFTALITDNYSRKTKYQEALALSLPCLSYTWVIDSVKNAILVDWIDYLLPAGESFKLDGAIRSRILPSFDPNTTSLETILAARPKLFENDNVIFVSGRSMEETKKASFLFILEALGAANIDCVIDLKAAAKLLHQNEAGEHKWLFVEDRGWKRGKEFFPLPDATKPGRKSARSSSKTRCKLASHETIVQSLILGKAYEDDVVRGSIPDM